MSEDLIKTIRKYALDNARKYGGVPNQGAVVGKLLGECPQLKSKLAELMPTIKSICDAIKGLNINAQIAELQKIAPQLLAEKKVVEEKKLKPLANAKVGEVVMRLAPSPSGPLQIGNAMVGALNYLYAKEYKGKLILRIEDTDTQKIYPPAYKMIEEDTNWFTNNHVDKIVVQSERMELYYEYAKKVIAKGKGYVCTCNADTWRVLAQKNKACPCRDLLQKEQIDRWEKMFTEFEPGDAVVRIKTDLDDPNPAMRDWPALRINHSTHPLQGTKYKVWPLMNFAVFVDDHELGVTHTIRGKDHVDNARRQKHLYEFFGFKEPQHAWIGRINIEGVEVSKTKTKKAIQEGKFDDWDDIRLPFIGALRRRGFQPGSIQKFAFDMGLGLNDKVVPAEDFFKSLEAHNRNIIDPIANRYFFVENPVKISVKNAPSQTVKLHLHPDDKTRGDREFAIGTNFYVSQEDVTKTRSKKLYRLMDALNFTKEGKEYVFDSVEYEKYKAIGEGTMHWLPVQSDLMTVEVLMPNKTIKKGFGEPLLQNVQVNEVVQLERFGFCRLDKKEGKKLFFWFAHR